MNLKERGITVGDLLIILIIILTTTILVKSFNKDKRKTINHTIQEEVFYGERVGRYRYSYNKNGQPYRDYF